MFRLLSFLILVTLCCSSIASIKVYKIVKPDGTVLYTDKPVPGAVLVEVGSPQNVTPALTSTSSRPLNTGKRQAKPSPPPTITITSPTHEQTLRSNIGEVRITGDVSKKVPGIYQLIRNGEIEAESNQPQFTLSNIPRGAHSIQIVLSDNKGKQLALSQEVTFFLHKASVNNR
ncbi:MAG: DUF4124 domain-containing protein [Aestuariibacter sp.]